MFRHALLLTTATLGAALAAAPANAITVDGVLDAGYGAAQSSVAYNPAAPQNNFGAPTAESAAIGYSIWLTSDANYVYGFIRTSGAGTSAGSFANLYFDIDPGNGAGSDIGFEITNNNVIFNGAVIPAPADSILSFANADTIEFAIANTLLDSPNPAAGDNVYLRLSQSFGYSVAGGASYGANGLGSAVLGGASAVPEPASWAMMIGGFGMAGGMMRRRAGRVSFANA